LSEELRRLGFEEGDAAWDRVGLFSYGFGGCALYNAAVHRLIPDLHHPTGNRFRAVFAAVSFAAKTSAGTVGQSETISLLATSPACRRRR